jgi:hypothetical protein
MLLLAATAVGFVRRRQYEIFYTAHIVLVAVIIVTGRLFAHCSTDPADLLKSASIARTLA